MKSAWDSKKRGRETNREKVKTQKGREKMNNCGFTRRNEFKRHQQNH